MARLPTIHQELRARNKGFKRVVGIDEAGRGPIAGPVVAACVLLKSFKFINKIDDSKRMTSAAREKAYHEILKKAYVGVGVVSEKIIESINIYNATVLAMKRALSNLLIKPDLLLIDGSMNLGLPIKQICIIKGDQKSVSIASASIIAKVTRDRLMIFYDTLFPDYGFSRHKGYPTKAHYSAVSKYGISPIHRKWGRLINIK